MCASVRGDGSDVEGLSEMARGTCRDGERAAWVKRWRPWGRRGHRTSGYADADSMLIDGDIVDDCSTFTHFDSARAKFGPMEWTRARVDFTVAGTTKDNSLRYKIHSN